MIFRYANKYYRQNKYYEAALLYEYLSNNSEFSWYQYGKERARKKFKDICYPKKPIFKLSAETDEKFLLRVLDIIVNDYDCDDKILIEKILKKCSYISESELLMCNYLGYENSELWPAFLNQWLAKFELMPIKIKSNAGDFFNNIYSFGGHSVDGDKVSVIMSAYNAENTVSYAINSILNQTYKNLEIIFIDDNSNDLTLDRVMCLKKNDDRIKIIKNNKNIGTYNNRNQAIDISRGKYLTVMDADDYSHPQRIELQVKALKENKEACAVLSDWVRITPSGKFIYKVAWKGGYQHEAAATFFWEKNLLKESIGYYDSVRFGADSEYICRTIKKFGSNSVFRHEVPLVFAAQHPGSLTANLLNGVDGVFGLSEIRRAYKKSWQHWHNSDKNLYLPNGINLRKFPAPNEMI